MPNADQRRASLNGRLLLDISRVRDHLHRELAKVFRQHNLTMMQFAVLDILHRRGDLSVGEIQTGILSTQGNVPVVIKNLIRQGHVERMPNQGDRRVTIIHLTTRGGQIIDDVFPPLFRRLDELLAGYSQMEKRDFSRLLRKLKKNNGMETT